MVSNSFLQSLVHQEQGGLACMGKKTFCPSCKTINIAAIPVGIAGCSCNALLLIVLYHLLIVIDV